MGLRERIKRKIAEVKEERAEKKAQEQAINLKIEKAQKAEREKQQIRFAKEKVKIEFDQKIKALKSKETKDPFGLAGGQKIGDVFGMGGSTDIGDVFGISPKDKKKKREIKW